MYCYATVDLGSTYEFFRHSLLLQIINIGIFTSDKEKKGLFRVK